MLTSRFDSLVDSVLYRTVYRNSLQLLIAILTHLNSAEHSDADIASCTVIFEISPLCLGHLCTRQATGLSCHSYPTVQYTMVSVHANIRITIRRRMYPLAFICPPTRFNTYFTPISPLSCIRRHVTHLSGRGRSIPPRPYRAPSATRAPTW